MYINHQPRPKIPPIGFFQPITTNPEDWMSDVEFLLGMLKKLNETITQVNSNTKFINDYSGKIEEIETEIQQLWNELSNFEEEINESIALQFSEIKAELQNMVALALTQANAYTDAIAANLEQEIRDISIGAITLYDPTTGLLSPLQTVIDNLYGSTRENALTATEYDNLELDADTYDGYEITAFNYDKEGKTILIGS